MPNTSKKRSQSSFDPTFWPADLGLERDALGACFCGQAQDAARLLEQDDFSLDSNRKIFAVICHLVEEGETELEISVVAHELRKRGELELVGGIAYLCSLTDGVLARRPMASRVAYLRKCAERRRFLRISEELEHRARDWSIDVEETRGWLSKAAQ